ncbi:hypothetical protein IV203_022198 [Nitzschia inconspicua]|uniref:Uncharacterized protein n=1 Tax=Nitzschia inconspicua TaxID=303405 RepID=A0A9K3KJ48_9STRA|nr:hypothetical protein IV203_022198 [Nitzschia inconspicua]
MESDKGSPVHKKARLWSGDGRTSNDNIDDCSFRYIQHRLFTVSSTDQNSSIIPSSLVTVPPIGNNVDRLQHILQNHGFRTAKVSTPRPAVSVYTDRNNKSTILLAPNADDARRFLLIALGLDPYQSDLEVTYERSFRERWCILQFCEKLRRTYFSGEDRTEDENDRILLEEELHRVNESCRRNTNETPQVTATTTLIKLATNVKNRRGLFHRAEEWERDYQCIQAMNSTLANVYLTLIQDQHQLKIHDMLFKPGEAKFERTTIILDDAESRKNPPFTLLLCANRLVTQGVTAVASMMVDSFFDQLLRLGYYAPSRIKEVIGEQLIFFFAHGLVSGNGVGSKTSPLSLKAHFDPTSPLAIYIHGVPGSGKSSLARLFPLALQHTLMQHTDPEYTVRFVKQNLNKPLSILELELEIRPNNNDFSLMSIIQSRKETMSQSKRGLVVLNLEEMPHHSVDGDPNQANASKLIVRRFGGRTVDIHQSPNGTAIPRNAGRLGIDNDFSLVTIFTSNYPLHAESRQTLEQLGLFRQLIRIPMAPIEDQDRSHLARSLFVKCCDEFGALQIRHVNAAGCLDIAVDVGTGDTRPLVQSIRILAFYLSELFSTDKGRSAQQPDIANVTVKQQNLLCSITVLMEDGTIKRLEVERLPAISCGCWFHCNIRCSDSHALSQILKLWRSRVLAPTVIVSSSKDQTRKLMLYLDQEVEFNCIRDINAATYKMSKSLYDRKDTSNLRDDILTLGHDALVAIELFCPTADSQLLIREMIEDSPSMTAFSSTQSALFKAGLLFVLCIEGIVTPEVASRVSLVLTDNETPNFPYIEFEI